MSTTDGRPRSGSSRSSSRPRETSWSSTRARSGQSALFGFVEIGELIFSGRSEVVVDPTAEGLRAEYGNARRLFLPMHAILRIEEVEREGAARAQAIKGSAQVTPFPVPVAPARDPRP
jgi:hypothetical protein